MVRPGTTVTTWLFLLFIRDHGSGRLRDVFATLACVLVASVVSHPAVATVQAPRVISVHTASASEVSMVLEVPPVQQNAGVAPEVSVTVGGGPVATTVTPMAARTLTVALVIDTAADMTAEALQAAKSGATEFLLRLPEGSRTMVIASGDDPRIVAPLSDKPADALSAVSALQPDGMRSTTAATLLAAQDLATAPLGPRAIVVYADGPDEHGVSVEQLIEAVSRAGAVLSVIQTSGDNDPWSRVVDRAGGEVLRTATVNLVQSYGDLATALGDRYIVEFEAPEELPGVAQVAVRAGDVESTTTVTLPAASTPRDAAQPSEREPAGGQLRVIAIVLVGLALIVLALLALRLRSRRRAPVDTERPSVAVTGPRAGSNSHVSELATIKNGDMRPRFPPDGAPSGTLTTAPVIRPQERRSRRGSLTDAVHGMRSALHALASQAEQELSQPPLKNGKQPPPPDDGRTRPRAPDSPIRRGKISAEPRAAPLQSRIGSTIAARVAGAEQEQSAEGVREGIVVLTGAGDAEVELARNSAGPAAVHISGNSASRYFAIRAVGTENDLVITLRPYQGVRSLNWNGGESTGFEVRATGSWRIEVLPLSAIPTFNSTFNGDGDMVVHFTGDGSLAGIIGNDAGRYFRVRTLGPDGTDRLVNTAQKYSGTCQISGGPQFFEVQAVGPWTITVK
jgi:von Willebrand factor type A domain